MRVLIYWSIGGIGGIQRIYTMLAKALTECGHSVTILTNRSLNPLEVTEMHGVHLSGVNIITPPHLTCINPLCDVVNSIIGSSKLYGLVNDYDAVYIDDLALGSLTINELIKHSGLIFYMHGLIDRVKIYVPLSKPHRMFINAITALRSSYRLIREAKLLLANSAFTSYVAYKTIGIRPRVLHPPVDTGLVAKFRSSIRENAVVSLGRLGAAKGHEFAIRLIQGLKERGIDAKLYIMGSASDAASRLYALRLINLAKRLNVHDRVTLILNSPLSKVYSILGKSKVFVQAKWGEPFGIVVVEAMAAGSVPIVPKSGGPWHDIVFYGKYGYGYSNLSEAIDAAEGVLTSDSEYGKLSEIVMRRAEEFSYNVFKNKVCRFLDELGN
ncbi:glycosyltransferase [Caldivirga maquilingensis]|nr:glycosyltransferase [Caldivirga maquilingensis]